MKTSELTGALLDYWVARAEGLEVKAMPKDQRYSPAARHMIRCKPHEQHEYAWHGVGYRFIPNFSEDWAQGGPIIEREKLDLAPLYDARNQFVYWASQPPGMGHLAMDDVQPLVAAMRAYVASKFGDEVDPVGAHERKAP